RGGTTRGRWRGGAVRAWRGGAGAATSPPRRSSSAAGRTMGSEVGSVPTQDAMLIGDSFVLRRLYTAIFEPPCCLQDARSPRDLEFFGRCPAPHASARIRAAGRASARDRRPVACLARNACPCPILDTSADTRGAR